MECDCVSGWRTKMHAPFSCICSPVYLSLLTCCASKILAAIICDGNVQTRDLSGERENLLSLTANPQKVFPPSNLNATPNSLLLHPENLDAGWVPVLCWCCTPTSNYFFIAWGYLCCIHRGSKPALEHFDKVTSFCTNVYFPINMGIDLHPTSAVMKVFS